MENVEKPLKDLVKGAGIYFIGIVISKFFTYFYRLVVARMGSEQYGILSLGLSFVGFLAVFSTLGLDNGVLRYVAYYKGKDDSPHIRGVLLFAFRVTLFVGLLLGFLLFVFSGWVSHTFFPHIDFVKLSLILKLVAIAVPLTALNFLLYAAFESFQKVKYEVYTKNILETSSKLFLSIILVYFGFKVVGLAVAYVVSIALGFILALFFIEKKVYPFLRSKVAPLYNNRELIAYSWPLVLSNFFLVIIGSVDIWMLGYFKNASDVGVYSAAYPTAQLLLIIPNVFLILFLPILTELYSKGEMSSFTSIYQITTKWIIMVSLLPLSLIMLFSRNILGRFFGAEYIPGSLALVMLTIGFFVYATAMASLYLLLVIKKTKVILLNYSVTIIFAVLLNLFLIPRYGVNGVAFTTALSYVLLSVMLLVERHFLIGGKFFKMDYLKCLLGICVVTGLVWVTTNFFVRTINLYVIIAFSIVSSVLYFLFLLVTKTFSKEDIMIIDAVQRKFGYNILMKIKFFRRFLEP